MFTESNYLCYFPLRDMISCMICHLSMLCDVIMSRCDLVSKVREISAFCIILCSMILFFLFALQKSRRTAGDEGVFGTEVKEDALEQARARQRETVEKQKRGSLFQPESWGMANKLTGC